MKKPRCVRFIAVAFGLIVAGALTAGDTDRAPKYQFKPGETYVYAVTIVGEIGSTTQTSKGTIQLTGKAADEKQVQLTPLVNLSTQIKQAPMPGKKGTKGGPSGPFGKGGPTTGKFVGAREWTIDPFGKLIKSSGATSLPLLLGTAEELVIEPLSAKGEKRWKLEKDLVVREGERAPKGPPRTSETSTSAKEVVTYEITGSRESLVAIKKTYDLKTAAQDGNSRIQFEGTADLTFDMKAGVMKTGEFKGAISVTEKNVTLKIPVTVSYRLLDAAEATALKKEQDAAREKAIQDAKDRLKPKPGTADVDINAAVADLKSGNKNAMRKAAERLTTATLMAERRDEVAKELAPLLKDLSLRLQVSKALKLWGTDKTVVPLLKDSDQFVRAEACKVLADVGTSECLPALKAAQADTSALVRREAENAVKAVEARKSPPK